MNEIITKTVREIALEMPLTTKVFETYKIDYCCGGNRKFSEACEIAGVETDNVLRDISECLKSSENTKSDWIKNTNLSRLIDHIVKTHHVFTREEIKNLSPLMIKVANKHGEQNPQLFVLEQLFSELCAELTPHLLKEEQVLFPYIKELESYKKNGNKNLKSCFGTIENPVGMMLKEHDSAGDILRKMREVSTNYELPENACPSFTALFTRLEEFEKDLHQHIHLENNLLFPKALKLENEIFEMNERNKI